MTPGFKTILLVAITAVAALAVGIHLFAPEYMRALGQALHGGR
jgi:hypothetical protein